MGISKNPTIVVNNFVTSSTTDHGALDGLGDNDHLQYLLSGTFDIFSSSVADHVDDTTIHYASGSIPHGDLQDIGTNSHAAIDTHIADGLIHFASGAIEHGDIAGLGDDDHTQYILADGTRAFSGDISHGSNDINSVGFLVATGITGAHSEVASGVPYLLVEGGIVISTASNGQITLSGSQGDIDWTDNGTELRTTSSVAIDTDGGFPSAQGSDIYFFVSGNQGGKGTSGVSVFGGDVEVSGTFFTDGVDNMLVPLIAGATQVSVEDMFNVHHSSGHVSGGFISVGSPTGSVDVTAGQGFIRATTNELDQLISFNWSASASILVPTGTICYIGVEYNAGSPIVVGRTVETWDHQTDFPLGRAIFEDDLVHIFENPQRVADHAQEMIRRLYETLPIKRDNRDGGLILAAQGSNRLVTVTAGALWDRLNRFPIDAMDTSASDTFDEYYRDGSGGLTIITGSTEWNNTQYDDGSGVLATLSNNRFTNRWFFIEVDGSMTMVFGTAEYNALASAAEETAPTVLPLRISSNSTLLGRFIIQEGSAGPPDQIDSAFATVLGGGAVTDHGNLSGLGDDDHPQYLLVSNFTPISASIATDINTLDTSITTLSGVVATDINTNQADIATNVSSITTLSGATAADINFFRFPPNVTDSTGDRTLTDADNASVVFMSGASANIVRVPATLTDGFHVTLAQASNAQIQIVATNNLFFPSTTFTSRSLEENSMLALYSSSIGVFLGGTLELV